MYGKRRTPSKKKKPKGGFLQETLSHKIVPLTNVTFFFLCAQFIFNIAVFLIQFIGALTNLANLNSAPGLFGGVISIVLLILTVVQLFAILPLILKLWKHHAPKARLRPVHTSRQRTSERL